MTGDALKGRVREAFRIESGERLRSMSVMLIELEKAPSRQDMESILETFYRDVHSLKGAARAVSFSSVERLSQELEGVLEALKENRLPIEAGLFDLLHRSLGLIEGKLQATGEGQGGRDDAETRDVMAALKTLATGERADSGSRISSPPRSPAEKTGTHVPLGQPLLAQSVRVPLAKLESLLRRSEEFIGLKLMARRQLQALKEVAARLPPGSDREDDLRSLVLGGKGDLLTLSTMVDGFLEEMKEITLLPLSALFELFPVMVREISRSQGKDIVLVQRGGEVQIDRRVLEELKDPLIHLLRNAIDHGFPGGGEGATGTITLEANQADANHISVVVSDDGLGLDEVSITRAALKKGTLKPGEAEGLPREQLLSLAFRSGISTNEGLTDVSGRGLGLSVVLARVEKLGGKLTVESEPGKGTAFKMLLPVTMATLRGILVRVSDNTYVVPTSELRGVYILPEEEVKVVNGGRVISVQDRFLPLASLAGILGLTNAADLGEESRSAKRGQRVQAMVLGSGNQQVALEVDAIGREDDLLAKGMGPQLGRVRHFSGTTLLGDGSLALILNTRELLETLRSRGGGPGLTSPPSIEAERVQRKILVVEDSFTSRTLLKDILEAAGYEVETAVDGKEAFTALRRRNFDLVVSDVEMPRMNGLDLTEAIRANQELSSLPVVLVSSLDRPEEREAGIRAGADAFVGKTSFDQANLLDVVRRYV